MLLTSVDRFFRFPLGMAQCLVVQRNRTRARSFNIFHKIKSDFPVRPFPSESEVQVQPRNNQTALCMGNQSGGYSKRRCLKPQLFMQSRTQLERSESARKQRS